VALLCVAAVH